MVRKTEIVRKKQGYTSGVIGTWIIILSIFITQLLFYTWCRVQCVQVGYEISGETENYQELLAIQNTLKIEIERLNSPERIAKKAKNDLGLITPMPNQKKIIVINDAN